MKGDTSLINSKIITNLRNEKFNFLKTTIEETNIPTVVVTHHSPSYKMLNNLDCLTNSLYASNYDYLFKNPVKAWVSGHTHSSKNILINDIPSVSNCYGYPGQNIKETKYDYDCKIVV